MTGRQDEPSGEQEAVRERQEEPSRGQEAMTGRQDEPSGEQEAVRERQEEPSRGQEAMTGRQDEPSGEQEAMTGRQDEPSGEQEAVREWQEEPSRGQEAMTGKQDEPSGEQEAVREKEEVGEEATEEYKFRCTVKVFPGCRLVIPWRGPFSVDWGDGSVDTNNFSETGCPYHMYDSNVPITVGVAIFSSDANFYNKFELVSEESVCGPDDVPLSCSVVSIERWGQLPILPGMFRDYTVLEQITDPSPPIQLRWDSEWDPLPDFVKEFSIPTVSDVSHLFHGCASLFEISAFSTWCMHGVTHAVNFLSNTLINTDLNEWRIRWTRDHYVNWTNWYPGGVLNISNAFWYPPFFFHVLQQIQDFGSEQHLSEFIHTYGWVFENDQVKSQSSTKQAPRISSKVLEEGGADGDSCQICQEEWEKNDNVVEPHCGHMLHTTCYSAYLEMQGRLGKEITCPVCRAPFGE
jgi:hypothetical protein